MNIKQSDWKIAPSRNLSHDESMIEYFVKHGCEQLRNKPIRLAMLFCPNFFSNVAILVSIYFKPSYKFLTLLDLKEDF